MQFFISVLLLPILIIVFLLLHESLHFIPLRLLHISFYTKVKTFHHIPIAYCVYSEYFNTSFNKLSTEKKLKYTFVAIYPYFVIFPISIFMMNSINYIIYYYGVIVLATHILNLPLEFLFIKEFKKNDCNNNRWSRFRENMPINKICKNKS